MIEEGLQASLIGGFRVMRKSMRGERILLIPHKDCKRINYLDNTKNNNPIQPFTTPHLAA